MIARLICLVAGAAILAFGIYRGSLLLVLAGTAVVAIGLARLGEVAAASQPKASRSGRPGRRTTRLLRAPVTASCRAP